jgi:hypothetical protein
MAVLVALAVCASADVVTLTDGSRVLGTVQRLQDGKLIMETQFAGTLEIDASLIETIATDAPVNVGVDTGDRLVGRSRGSRSSVRRWCRRIWAESQCLLSGSTRSGPRAARARKCWSWNSRSRR